MMKELLLGVSAIVLAAGLFNATQNTYQVDSSIPAYIHTLYSKWTVKYGRLSSTPAESQYRLRVFYHTHLEIQEIRKRMPSAEFSLNAFADLTVTEFAANMLGAEPYTEEEIHLSSALEQEDEKLAQALPASYFIPNQRAVQTQGMCGSCWAWTTKHLTQDALNGSVEISAQNIMNCNNEGKHCSGGWIDKGLISITTHGYRTESEVPYVGRLLACGGASPLKISKIPSFAARLTSEVLVKSIMMKFQSSLGVAVQAENQTWKSFRGGIFKATDSTCSNPNVNHAVTIVGWDESKGSWKLRNSWGSNWGDQGYMWLEINRNFESPGKCFCGAEKGDQNCYAGFWR